MNEQRLKEFEVNYVSGLRDAVIAHPDDYAYTAPEVPVVVARMMKAIRENVHNVYYGGHGFRLTCKRLGIKHTKKAIIAYLRGN
jgi:hypothetical protein